MRQKVYCRIDWEARRSLCTTEISRLLHYRHLRRIQISIRNTWNVEHFCNKFRLLRHIFIVDEEKKKNWGTDSSAKFWMGPFRLYLRHALIPEFHEPMSRKQHSGRTFSPKTMSIRRRQFYRNSEHSMKRWKSGWTITIFWFISQSPADFRHENFSIFFFTKNAIKLRAFNSF